MSRAFFMEETMSFDSLIFDLDGTLWDCSGASAEAFNLAFEEFGVSRRVTREYVRSISGKPAAECDELLLRGTDPQLRNALSRRLDDLEIEAVRRHAASSLFAGVEAGLQELARRYRLCLVSNCGVRYLQAFHECSEVGHHFVDSECFGRTGKLKDRNIRSVVERQNLSAPCYIGDTAGDEEAAQGAQVPFFHAAYGFGHPSFPVRVFPSFDELVQYFREVSAEVGN
jgi:phosphoglycolate phosphatase